jgi:hypothetical protein
MSEQTPKPQPPPGQYGAGQTPTGPYPPAQPPSEPPAGEQPPTEQPPGEQPPGQHPPAGQYPPGQPPPAQYLPPSPYPPGQQYPPQRPPGQRPGKYRPGLPTTGQYPPGQQPPIPPGPQPPTGQYSPTPPPTYPPGQQPPKRPPTGQYPPPAPYPPPTGQYPPQPPAPYPPGPQPPQQPPQQPPTGQYPPQPPPTYPPGQPPPTGQYPPTGPYPPPGPYPPTQPPGPYPGPTPGPYDPTQGYGPSTPVPPPTDPCDQERRWGPPEIRPECCPKDRDCCGTETDGGVCSWDEVDDPCVRASSAECGVGWTRLSCKCESSEGCGCDEWDCGYPTEICVPCKPCEGLLPNGDDTGTNGPTEPGPNGCSYELRRQLEESQRDILAQQTEKAKIEAQIKSDQEREKELSALVADFDKVLDKYKTDRPKLICREDCLKRFYDDTVAALQQEFSEQCLDDMRDEVNDQLCWIERNRCCQKNLEWKLEKATRLLWEQKEAEKQWKKISDAFAALKDLGKWIGDVFTDLEKLKDQITQALNEKDALRRRWAFYLFYWKFVPRFCRRFPVAFCCESPQTPDQRGQTYTPTPSQPPHIGCKPGDWFPSKIDRDLLEQLICCAWKTVGETKASLDTKNAEVEKAKQNLAFIKKQAEDAGKALEDRIKSRIEGVVCGQPGGGQPGGQSTSQPSGQSSAQ